jgi:WD40 repeat protein
VFSNNCFCVPLPRDAVTCVQFNPVDDSYFLSGALDDKLRIWNIAEHQVVDWIDLREMITALSYTPDGEVLLHFLFDFPFHPGKSVSYLLLVEDLTNACILECVSESNTTGLCLSLLIVRSYLKMGIVMW